MVLIFIVFFSPSKHPNFGVFLVAYSCKIANCSVLQAEILTILHGLRIIKNRRILDEVIVESDFLLALELVNEGCTINHSFYSIISYEA